jgi:capsular polysaccharide biosynthesis protein
MGVQHSIAKGGTIVGLKSFLKTAFSRLWLVVTLSVAAALCVGFLSAGLSVPQFESAMKIMIAGAEGEGFSTSVFDEIRSAQLIGADFSEIITSHSVLSSVINDTGLREDVDTLKESIQVRQIQDTRILEISVTYTSQEKAMEIIDSLQSNFKAKLAAMGSPQSFMIVDEPMVHIMPNGSYYILYILLATFGGMVLGVTMNFILDEFIKRIDSVDVTERLLGIRVIGVIPNSTLHRSDKYDK